MGISINLLFERLRFCNDLYLFKEDWAIETNAFVDIFKYNSFSGNDWGISEKLFPEKLIPMTLSEKFGALVNVLFEQSANSFPLKFLHVQTLLNGHFSLNLPLMHKTIRIGIQMQHIVFISVKLYKDICYSFTFGLGKGVKKTEYSKQKMTFW